MPDGFSDMDMEFSDLDMANHIRSMNFEDEDSWMDDEWGGDGFESYLNWMGFRDGGSDIHKAHARVQKIMTDGMKPSWDPISPPYQMDWGKRIE